MLKIFIPAQEVWSEADCRFYSTEPVLLVMEHSLHAVALWEEHYHKSFFINDEKNKDEMDYYIWCMCQNEVPRSSLKFLTKADYETIKDYLEDPHTATTFKEKGNHYGKGKTKITTAEVIYYQMIARTIPLECEYWNLNRLMALIRVYDVLSNPKKHKSSLKEMAQERSAINAARKAKMGTTG